MWYTFYQQAKRFSPKGPSSVAQEYKTEQVHHVLFCTLVQLKKALLGRNVLPVGKKCTTCLTLNKSPFMNVRMW